MFRATVSRSSRALPRLANSPIPKVGKRHAHMENTADNWGPWVPFMLRNPNIGAAMFFGIMGLGFSAPFMTIQYQLMKQNKHLGWYPAEWETVDEE